MVDVHICKLRDTPVTRFYILRSMKYPLNVYRMAPMYVARVTIYSRVFILLCFLVSR